MSVFSDESIKLTCVSLISHIIMTHFRSKLQISSVLLSQNNKQAKKLGQQSLDLISSSSSDYRSLWSYWLCRKVLVVTGDESQAPDGSDKSVRGARNRPAEAAKLVYNPNCTSKCLGIKNCDKDNKERMDEVMREKLSNCLRVPEKKMKKSKSHWRNMIFAICNIQESKIPDYPNAFVCRRVHRETSIPREPDDPRVLDPSKYEATSPGQGDLLFSLTEAPPKSRDRESCVSREPQPRPPPSHKLPKAAVLTKIITERAKNITHDCTADVLRYNDASYRGTSKCSIPEPSTTPFQEMRPTPVEPVEPRLACKHGIRYICVRTKDPPSPPSPPTVPIERDSEKCLLASKISATDAVYGSNCTHYPRQLMERTESDVVDRSKTSGIYNNDCNALPELSIHETRKFSRIEQLKQRTRSKRDGG